MSKKNERPKKQTGWRCDEALLNEFQEEAVRQGYTPGVLLEKLMEDYLNNLR
jgi:hypothetical protein